MQSLWISAGPQGFRNPKIVRKETSEPGLGEVRVLVASVSFADLVMREGLHPEWTPLPFKPGWDIIGGGRDRSGRVASNGPDGCGSSNSQSYVQHICLPESELAPVPDGLNPAEAVSRMLICNSPTSLDTWKAKGTALIESALCRASNCMEEAMTLTKLSRTAALAAMIAVGMMAAAAAQTTPADPHHTETTLTQAMPPSGMMGQGIGAQPAQSSMPPGQPAMVQPGMMGQGMMGRGMTGMPGAIPMKIMFAIADANGDGGLSFDEVMAIHKRVFDRVDANKDGRATPEEIQAFMRE
jgi:hypothetical protein